VLFHAETLDATAEVDYSAPWALSVENACFQWEQSAPSEVKSGKSKRPQRPAKPDNEPKSSKKAEDVTEAPKLETPFALNNINLTIPRGQLCAITGPVGSGKLN
jgi:ATP-binding cassette, subfamily C (CFTR/MRP), member 1